MSDPSEVPPEHLWITRLIARGMARADEEGTAFHRGGLPDATEADRTLHREYLEEAWIAEREAKVSRIEHHRHIWDRGGFEGRDSCWADRARKAVARS